MALSKEVTEKMAALITSAFGLIAALAWNSAIQDLFARYAWLSRGGPWVYAVLVTIIAVIATIWIGRVSERKN